MKPLRVIAFLVAGCAWGWFLGDKIPTKDSFFLSRESAQVLDGYIGLVGGLIVGAISGTFAARFLSPKLFYLPILVLLCGFLPLPITVIENRRDEIQRAIVEVQDKKREQALFAEGRRVLDSFAKAAGWSDKGHSWQVRTYDLTDDPEQVRAHLLSLGATDRPRITTSSTLFMEILIEHGHLYLQVTPKSGGGTRAMAQF